MAVDIRLNVEFFRHPKTVKLKNRLDLDGVVSLIKLWMWAAKNRPEGLLSNLSIEDIEIAAEWQGKPGVLHGTLVTLRWLDTVTDEGNETYALHDWRDHNEWAAGAVDRGDRARFSRMASTHPDLYARLAAEGRDYITRDEYLTLTKQQRDVDDSLTPVERRPTTVDAPLTPPPPPSPSPVPVKNDPPSKEKMERARQEQIKWAASKCLELLPKFGSYAKRDDDNAWLTSLYTNPANEGIDIYRAIVEALKWTNKRKIEVKNVRAYITDWLENLRKQRMKKQ